MRHDGSNSTRSRRRVRGSLLALAAAVLLAPASLGAGEDEAAKSKISKAGHLEYRRNYEGALLEARIRNLPVFVSRHKDF